MKWDQVELKDLHLEWELLTTLISLLSTFLDSIKDILLTTATGKLVLLGLEFNFFQEYIDVHCKVFSLLYAVHSVS